MPLSASMSTGIATGMAVGGAVAASQANSCDTRYSIRINQCNAMETKAETLQCLKELESDYDQSQSELLGILGIVIMVVFVVLTAIIYVKG